MRLHMHFDAHAFRIMYGTKPYCFRLEAHICYWGFLLLLYTKGEKNSLKFYRPYRMKF